MSIMYVRKEERIVGTYMTDHARIAPTHKDKGFWLQSDNKFLPILNLFSFNEDSFRMADPNDAANDIELHNNHDVRYTLSSRVKDEKRLVVTQGDLLLGDTRVVLNFMEVPVVIKDHKDEPKLFLPLTNTQLQDYKGKVVVFTFRSYTTPGMMKDVIGVANYFDNLRNEEIDKGLRKSPKVKRYEYLSQCWRSYKPETPGMVASNSIKLVTMVEYTHMDFMLDGKTYDDVYCRVNDLTLRKSNSVLNLPQHPKVGDDLLANRELVKSMRDNGISCFIVDNGHHIGPRFANFINEVKEIPRAENKDLPEGLYIVSLDSSNPVAQENFTELSKIDELPYIYKTREEAQNGADVHTQAAREHEMNKLGVSNETLELRKEMERVRLEAFQRENKLKEEARITEAHLQEEMRRRDAEYQAEKRRKDEEYQDEKRQKDLEYEERLRRFKLEEEDRKGFYSRERYNIDTASMYNKHHYETLSYERSSTIETIKTVGSVAGLLAGGYVIFKQLSK